MKVQVLAGFCKNLYVFFMHSCVLYPVERDGFVSVLAAVEENVSCSFQNLQQEAGFLGAQSNVLSCLAVAPKEIQRFKIIFNFFCRAKQFKTTREEFDLNYDAAYGD